MAVLSIPVDGARAAAGRVQGGGVVSTVVGVGCGWRIGCSVCGGAVVWVSGLRIEIGHGNW